MTNLKDAKKAARKSAKEARRQLEQLDLSALKNLNLDDLDLNVLRQREDEAASRGFFGGFLLGAIVGAVIALVFAPRRGDETRELVVGAAGDLRERATGLVHHVRSDGEDAASTAKQEFNNEPAIEREIGDAAETTRETIDERADQTRQSL